MIAMCFAFLRYLGGSELMFLFLISLPLFSFVVFCCLNSAGQSCLARSFKADVSTCPNCRMSFWTQLLSPTAGCSSGLVVPNCRMSFWTCSQATKEEGDTWTRYCYYIMLLSYLCIIISLFPILLVLSCLHPFQCFVHLVCSSGCGVGVVFPCQHQHLALICFFMVLLSLGVADYYY